MSAEPSRDRSREFDIIVWGATGYSGALIAEHLVRHAPDDVRWALAGRGEAKLKRGRDALARIEPKAAELPLVVADSHDRASLDAMAARTSVLCAAVGPFALHGSGVVEACLAAGTDYCDITGEIHWVRRMIDAHHDAAREAGIRIVPCCGFDSVPSDLGVFMLQDAAKERFGGGVDKVRFYLGRNRGSVSGGTVASMLNLVQEARTDREARRILLDPYALDPAGMAPGPDGAPLFGVERDPHGSGWIGPFMMAAVNERVVRRTHALLGRPWGEGFSYREATRFPDTARGLFMASALSAGMAAFTGVAAAPPLRRLLEDKVLPKAGEGASREKRERGHFDIEFVGEGKDDDGRAVTLRGRVKGGDPYTETGTMAGESALCLALDGAALGTEGGVTTPAAAMGMRLVERLRAVGMTFSVD